MPSENVNPPAQILQAIKSLWEAAFSTEKQAFDSGHFRMLGHICSSIYPEIPGSRLPKAPADDLARRELQDALCDFLRRLGAPWYAGDPPVTAEEAAARLHAAFLLSEVQRTYLAPLVQLGLMDTTKRPHEEFRRICFGSCEIVLLYDHQLLERVAIQTLRRFQQRYWFQSERLAGFFYLTIHSKEPAGPIWQRGRWTVFHQILGQTMLIRLTPKTTRC
jgi:hypothetical protein